MSRKTVGNVLVVLALLLALLFALPARANHTQPYYDPVNNAFVFPSDGTVVRIESGDGGNDSPGGESAGGDSPGADSPGADSPGADSPAGPAGGGPAGGAPGEAN